MMPVIGPSREWLLAKYVMKHLEAEFISVSDSGNSRKGFAGVKAYRPPHLPEINLKPRVRGLQSTMKTVLRLL